MFLPTINDVGHVRSQPAVRVVTLPDLIFPDFMGTQMALECRIWSGPAR